MEVGEREEGGFLGKKTVWWMMALSWRNEEFLPGRSLEGLWLFLFLSRKLRSAVGPGAASRSRCRAEWGAQSWHGEPRLGLDGAGATEMGPEPSQGGADTGCGSLFPACDELGGAGLSVQEHVFQRASPLSSEQPVPALLLGLLSPWPCCCPLSSSPSPVAQGVGKSLALLAPTWFLSCLSHTHWHSGMPPP